MSLGVTCVFGRVRRIDWRGRGLRRLELPWRDLADLRYLDVSSNGLAELPPEIGELTNLEWLYASQT